VSYVKFTESWYRNPDKYGALVLMKSAVVTETCCSKEVNLLSQCLSVYQSQSRNSAFLTLSGFSPRYVLLSTTRHLLSYVANTFTRMNDLSVSLHGTSILLTHEKTEVSIFQDTVWEKMCGGKKCRRQFYCMKDFFLLKLKGRLVPLLAQK
jgi:hypothetical protein